MWSACAVNTYSPNVMAYIWHLAHDLRGWGGWMASMMQWTRVWASSGSWWWTGKPGVLQSMGSQRVGHDWATELHWTWGVDWAVLGVFSSFSHVCSQLEGRLVSGWPRKVWGGGRRRQLPDLQRQVAHLPTAGLLFPRVPHHGHSEGALPGGCSPPTSL